MLMLMRLSLLIFLFFPFALISQSDIEARLLRFEKKIESTKKLTTEKKYDEALNTIALAEKELDHFQPRPDSLQADLLMAKGYVYFKKSDKDLARKFYQEASDILAKPGQDINAFEYCQIKLILLSILNGDVRPAVSLYEKDEAMYVRQFGETHLEYGSILAKVGWYYFTEKFDFEKSLHCFEKAINIFEPKKENLDLIHCYNSVANLYNWKTDYENSAAFSQKAYELSLAVYGKEHISTGISLLQLGMTYNGWQKYDEAVDHYLVSLDILRKIEDEHKEENIGNLLALIRNAYLNKKAYKKSSSFGKQYIDHLLKEKKINKNKLAAAYNATSMILEKDQDYAGALDYVEKSLFIFENELPVKNDDQIGFGYMNKSSIYLSLNKLNLAEESAKKSLKYLAAESVTKGFNAYDKGINTIIRNHRNLAEIYRLRKDYKKAESYYDKIFELFGYKKDGDFLKISNKALLFQVVSLYAELYSEWGKNSNDLTHLKRSEELFDQSLKLYNYRRKNQSKEDSKLILSKDGLKNYEGYINLLNELFKQTDDPKYVHQIFDISEKSKAASLYEALQHAKALNFAGIPDSLIAQEQDLKLQINLLDKKRDGLLMSGASETNPTLLALSSNLFDARQAYQTLEKYFEVNYPAYFQLKFDLNTINLKEVQQNLLSTDQTLIEYFVGEKSIFILVINQDEAKVVEVKRDFPLAEWVKDFRKSNEEHAFHMEIKTYCSVAHNLYNKLMAPIAADLKDQLIIVPDGVLGYLSFEALLVEPVIKVQRFKKHHFLIRDKQISYSYSTTLLKQLKERQHKMTASKKLLAFAPFFDGDTTMLTSISRLPGEEEVEVLKPLPNTGEEVYGIQKIIGGDVYYKMEATEEKFIEQAHNYKIIHLATHGKANDQAGDFSYLAFTVQKDSIENEIIYMRDLYNLQLNADMVVLSACETGIGELQKGEGIISLARGFTYAGAKSIITSLWSVEDKCTKEIMIAFYKYLDQGHTKDAALRQAKLDYLNNDQTTHVDAHPFYWSPFIGIGDMNKL